MSIDSHAKNSIIDEIREKFRLSFTITAFVIIALVAIIIKYLYEPASSVLSFIPDLSVGLIIVIVLFMAFLGAYLSLRISRQVIRIIDDYSTRLERILEITKDMREELYGDILLEKIMDAALSMTRSKAGSVLLLEEGHLVFKIVRGEAAEKLTGAGVDMGKGIAGWVAEHGMPVRISDASTDDRFDPAIDLLTGYETRSVLCVPLRTSSGVLGVLELLNKEGGHAYRERDEEIITYLAEQAAISILKTKFYEDQKNYEIHLTDMLLEAIDFHIPEKKGHSRRVARYGNIMAKGFGMSDDEQKRLYFASLLHDVGFLKLDSGSTFKKEEYMRHPVVGYEMISPINFYADIAPFILHHHERYDGYGYPSGMKGEEIPIEARIVAIAEAFDAMTSASSYRVPVSFEEAVKELQRKAGTQFDPELVQLFTSLVEPRHMSM